MSSFYSVPGTVIINAANEEITLVGDVVGSSSSGEIIATISDEAVSASKIADAAVTTEKIADGAVAFDKLTSLPAGHLIVGGYYNVAAGVQVAGDIVIDSDGITAIVDGVIVDEKINNNAAIAGTKIQQGSTSVRGTVQLTDSISSESTTTAATPNAVKSAYDLAAGALPKSGGAMNGVVEFVDEQTFANTVPPARQVATGTGLTGGGDLSEDLVFSADVASQTEAEAGTSSTKLMTPQRTAQAIAALSPGGGATGGGDDQVFVENEQVVTASYTLPTGKNASSVGPVSLDAGVTVTISANSTWVIL